jgi:nucleoid DNA-binding protein
MTKAQIIDILAEGTGLTKTETAAVIDGFLATINWAVGQDKRVMLRGFGTFQAVQRRERLTRNPRTGEKITVAARRAVVFRPAKELREDMNKPVAPAPEQQSAVAS